MLVLRYQLLGFWRSKKQIWIHATFGLHGMLRLSSLVSEKTVYLSFKFGIKLYFHNRPLARFYLFFPPCEEKNCSTHKILQWITYKLQDQKETI